MDKHPVGMSKAGFACGEDPLKIQGIGAEAFVVSERWRIEHVVEAVVYTEEIIHLFLDCALIFLQQNIIARITKLQYRTAIPKGFVVKLGHKSVTGDHQVRMRGILDG